MAVASQFHVGRRETGKVLIATLCPCPCRWIKDDLKAFEAKKSFFMIEPHANRVCRE